MLKTRRFYAAIFPKCSSSPPPVEVPAVTEQDIAAFREKYQIQAGQRIIGMNARLATEKGVEYLIEAMPEVMQKYPTARVLHVGPVPECAGRRAVRPEAGAHD